MNKVTTSSHPLAALRAICGFTREDVAKIAGITASSVQNIELERAPMPMDVARRIEAATGCKAACLRDQKAKPVKLDGEPYVRISYTNYQKASTATTEAVEAAADDLQFRLRTLLQVSADSKFLYVVRRLSDALDAVLNEAEISMPELDSLERKTASVAIHEMTIAQLHEKLWRSPMWKKRMETPPLPPEGPCRVVVETYRHWPTSEIPHGIIYARRDTRHRYRIEFADGSPLEVVTEDWVVKGVSGKATSHPKEGDQVQTVPSPAFVPRPARKKPPGKAQKTRKKS